MKIPNLAFCNFLLIGILLAGCSDELKKKEEAKLSNNKVNRNIPLKSLTKDSISYSVKETSEPNRYTISFQWEKTDDFVDIFSERKRQSFQSQESGNFNEVVEGGFNYQYSFSLFSSEKILKEQFDILIKVPRDYELTGPLEVKGDQVITANRVFIRSDALITTYRNNLTINANQIISEGGIIQNYPWGLKDCNGSLRGHDGGHITINSKDAHGNLKIAMSGARGCFPRGAGGAGGHLAVSIEDGSLFYLVTDLKSALGAEEKKGFMGPGPTGSPPTSCISLSKNDKNNCQK